MNKLLHPVSLRGKLFRLTIVSAAAAVLLWFVLHYAVGILLNRYFSYSDFIENAYTRTAADLQKYVTDNSVSMSDETQLDRWQRRNKDVQFSIFYQDELMYSSDATEVTSELSSIDEDLVFDRERYYTITFTDGVGDVVLFGAFDYSFYIYAEAVEAVVCVVLFFILLMLGIRSSCRYIEELQRRVEEMSCGDLSHPVNVRGRDELGRLAGEMEEMRLAFQKETKEASDSLASNRKLVTTMSHDLRTPLTSVLLYTEILQNKTYRNEQEEQEYLDRLRNRTLQIKTLSDSLFYRFLMPEAADAPTEDEALLQKDWSDIFPEVLSDFICTLRNRGFTVEAEETLPQINVKISLEFFSRIMDNLLSNILKYADTSVPVTITARKTEKQLVLCIANRVAKVPRSTESTGIGLRNIVSMMEKIGGSCRTTMADDIFTSELTFAGEAVRESDDDQIIRNAD